MMRSDPGEIEVKMQRYYKFLSQKDHRIWAAIEALKVG
jgi:glycine cleavage system protein P-like pyridoxal-binding family